MNSAVVSATTPCQGRSAAKRDAFLSKANVLLGAARRELDVGRSDQALELACQAALRTAGARIATSSVAVRKRKPRGAWAQLELVDADGAAQARQFAAYSRLRSRVMNGISEAPATDTVAELLDAVETFLNFAELEVGLLPAAA